MVFYVDYISDGKTHIKEGKIKSILISGTEESPIIEYNIDDSPLELGIMTVGTHYDKVKEGFISRDRDNLKSQIIKFVTDNIE